MTGLILGVLRTLVRLAGVNPVRHAGKAPESAAAFCTVQGGTCAGEPGSLATVEETPLALPERPDFDGWTIKQIALEIIQRQDAFHEVPIWASIEERAAALSVLNVAWEEADFLGHHAVVASWIRNFRAAKLGVDG